MATGDFFPEVKRPGREYDRSPSIRLHGLALHFAVKYTDNFIFLTFLSYFEK
jgi:hypothetical protein